MARTGETALITIRNCVDVKGAIPRIDLRVARCLGRRLIFLRNSI